MKKLIALLLTLVLALGLCACADMLQNSSADPSESTNVPTYAIALRFTINPEFIVYLDADQNILSVEAENEDAEALLSQLDVAGQPYAEAITTILDTAYTDGYLTDGAQISVEVESSLTTDANLAFINSPITTFELEKGIATDIAVNLSTDSEPESGSVVIDGRTYRVSTSPLYDGETEEQIGTITYCVTKRLTEEDDTTVFSKKLIERYDNGDVTIRYFHNDVILRVLTTYADGSVYDVSYFNNDSQSSYYVSSPNGDYTYLSFAEDGTVLKLETVEDGIYTSEQPQEDGTTHTYLVYPDGKHIENIFNTNGTMIKYIENYPNGDYNIITYYDNGAMQYDEAFLAGAHIFAEYYASGTIKNSKRIEADGSWQEFAFDRNEQIISWQQYDANGQLIGSDTYTEEQPEQETAE